VKLTVELLDKKKHDRQTFDCGLPVVNEFLQKQASRQMRQKINRTWVLVDRSDSDQSNPTPIAGYFTLTTATVVKDELPSKEPKGRFPGYPIPVFKLAWIGVDSSYQGKGYFLGETLLLEALHRSYSLSEYGGMGVAVVTDPLTDRSESFFQQYGFRQMNRPFRDRDSLYLSMGIVKTLIEESDPE
jgi:GNAT superfamily N-acetyltransferase